MAQEINTTALAILLLAKIIAKKNKKMLTKADKLAFAQIANAAGSNLPAFAEMIDSHYNEDSDDAL